MSTKRLISYLLLLHSCLLSAQGMQPQWVSNPPIETNATYKFVKVVGMGSSLRDAELACIDKLSMDESLIRSVDISKVSTLDRITNQQVENGKLSEVTKTENKVRLQIKGQAIQLQAKLVDEHVELVKANGGQQYRVAALYMVALQSSPVFDHISVRTGYGARGLWRSAIVPGWGQLHKGSTLKGILVLGGEALLVGGAIASENLRASYVKKIAETRNVAHMRAYSANADNMQNARNIFIVGIAALYAYSLIDAVAAPGAKRLVIRQNQFALTPVATPEYAGVGLTIKF
ncbi:MAG: DUF5683 domain-containing protein [Prevotellaceae bacterium]|jgi:hypothetical protein|nr:DUF5683 domain-containing protein [Prevotellaceae bacterium]